MVRILSIATIVAWLASAPVAVMACPLCKDAIAATDAEDEVNNLPAAYNRSIYMMIGVPYASLGFVGFLIYRGLKKNESYFERMKGDTQV
ncbi:MAG: hypothetical protein WCL32_22370 [Planctomycetota bacterium]|jgi:Na+-driven multidrug efflux pump